MSNICVIGAGAWGVALAAQAARAGRQVTLWARTPARLAGLALPTSVTIVDRLPEGPLNLLAVPVQHLRDVAARLPGNGAAIVCAKGVEATSLLFPLEILADIAPNRPAGVLTGPNFAHEIQAGLPAAAVVAGNDPALRDAVIAALGTPTFRLYGNDDPIGAQVGGAAKNVVAIAAGAVIGAGLGENARAAVVTRGLAELARLAEALGGKPTTVAGLSGLGDLMLTCAGAASRNFSLGIALGKGSSLATILQHRSGVTEGVATAPALAARATKIGVAMPVCAAVAAVVSGNLSVRGAMEALLSRPLRNE